MSRAALHAYRLGSHLLPLAAPLVLRRRLARGIEDPTRWREKLGHPGQPRPAGVLIWLNAVGLGEVLALRGLVAEMARQAPAARFLITSTARTTARVMAQHLPANSCHQLLPLDAPQYVARFLDHWRPALAIWAEQEIWPNAVMAATARDIPQVMLNARITAAGHARRARVRGLYQALFPQLARVMAQDEATAQRLQDLGATQVEIGPALKPAAPPLTADPAEVARLQAALAGRPVWVAASTHPDDEAEALAAATARPDRLLILVPRDTAQADGTAAELTARALPHVRRSRGEVPGPETRVWLADSYGELGLWYRLAPVALIGGSFGPIGGHNPWEAIVLGCAVLYGPNTANFIGDYATLAAAGAARQLAPGDLAAALTDPALTDQAARARALVTRARAAITPLAGELLGLAGLDAMAPTESPHDTPDRHEQPARGRVPAPDTRPRPIASGPVVPDHAPDPAAPGHQEIRHP